MPEDATLDRFRSLDTDDSDGAGEDERPGGVGDEVVEAKTSGESATAETPTTPAPVGADVAPAASTYRWHPDGVACADCGSTAARLWQDGASTAATDDEVDARLVCADCKNWREE